MPNKKNISEKIKKNVNSVKFLRYFITCTYFNVSRRYVKYTLNTKI